MKTVIKIENDYNSNLAYELRNENIANILSELSVFCEVANNKLINIVKQLQTKQTYKEDYKNSLTVNATGYSQGDWQEYKLYYNDDINKDFLNNLVNLLEKSFTHQNDYFVTKYEEEVINNKVFKSEPIDYTTFCIDYIEFPSKEEVLKEYQSCYGVDYDKVEINID